MWHWLQTPLQQPDVRKHISRTQEGQAQTYSLPNHRSSAEQFVKEVFGYMARSVHLFEIPDRFVLGVIGESRNRLFYLQIASSAEIMNVMLEKHQARLLSERLDLLLDEVARRFHTTAPFTGAPGETETPEFDLLDTEFFVGTIGLGWNEQNKNIVIELLAVTDEEIDLSSILTDTPDGPDSVRITLSPSQARNFLVHTQDLLAADGDICPLCGEVITPHGHVCMRTNGYHRGRAMSMLSKEMQR